MDEIIQKVLANILTIMKNSSLSELFCEMVLKRLVSFGYYLEVDDGWAISFVMQKIENHIKNSCNTANIPEELFHVAVDMVCGEFLLAKKQTGRLELDNIDLNGAIKQISEGDTTVSFADGSSDEEKFNLFLNHLLHNGEGDFVCYRKLKW